jgi:hypothetical protein
MINIELGKHSFVYSTNGMRFAWLKKYGDKYFNECWHECREEFYDDFWNVFSNAQKRLRFVMANTLASSVVSRNSKAIEMLDNWAVSAQKSVNTLEKHLGFALTKITKLETPGDSSGAYYVSASGRWMRAPQLLSLYLLVIRLNCYPTAWNIFNTVTHGKLSTVATKLNNFEDKLVRVRNISREFKGDALQFRNIVDGGLAALLDNVEEFFLKRTSRAAQANQGGDLGIYNLLCANCADDYLLEKKRKIMRKTY